LKLKDQLVYQSSVDKAYIIVALEELSAEKGLSDIGKPAEFISLLSDEALIVSSDLQQTFRG